MSKYSQVSLLFLLLLLLLILQVLLLLLLLPPPSPQLRLLSPLVLSIIIIIIIIIIINRLDFSSLICLLTTYVYLEVFSSAHSFQSLIFYVPSPKSRYHVSQLTNNLPEFSCIPVFTGLPNSFFYLLFTTLQIVNSWHLTQVFSTS